MQRNDERDEKHRGKNNLDVVKVQRLRNVRNKEETELPFLLNKQKHFNFSPWKIVVHNVQSLVSENSKLKIDYYKEYAIENKVLLLNFTETWLHKDIKEDAEIEGYIFSEVINKKI